MYVLQFNPTMDMEHAPISSLHSWYMPEHTVIKQLFKKKKLRISHSRTQVYTP